MIRLFRKTRQQLLSDNSYSMYLLYASGEILLVVVGILLALQIDNWNENKKSRYTEQQYLLALMEEFYFNDEELERVSTRNKANADNMVKLVNQMGPGEVEINEEEMGSLLRGSLSNEIQFNPSEGVLDEIISSGKLGMFSSPDLRFALSSWSGKLYKVRLKEQELSRIRFITIDIIRNEGNLRMALGSIIEELGIEKAKFKKGNLPLLRSTIFEGHMMGAVTMSLSLQDNHYPTLEAEMEKILMIIDDELK